MSTTRVSTKHAQRICRVHKPRVPHGPASQQRLDPAANMVNKHVTHGPAQVPKRQARRAIQSPIGRSGGGGTASVSDSGPPFRPERSLRSPARFRTASPTERPGQNTASDSDRACAEPLLTALLQLARSEPTGTNRPGTLAR